MTVSACRISADQVRALADGTAAGAELEILLRGQRSKVLAMIELITRRAAEVRHPEAAATAAGRDLLARVQRREPTASERVLRYPAVSAWAADTLLALDAARYRGPARPGHLAAIGASAAILGGLPATVEIPPPTGSGTTLHLPLLGSAALPPQARSGAVVLRHAGGRTEISWPRTTASREKSRATLALPADLDSSQDGWRALAAAPVGLDRDRRRLMIDDADPYRLPGSLAGLAPVTDPERGQWQRRIGGGWGLLARDDQRTASEVLSLISALTPMRAAGGASRSITSRRAFGAIGLSLPADDTAMALVLAHEVQHAKLCALMDLLPLTKGQTGDRFYAPWRPDPRPLTGLVHGLYAHLGVTRFWWLRRETAGEPAEVHRAQVEFARWRCACAQVAAIIRERPELTAYGTVFVDGTIRLLRRWEHERVPQAARDEARIAAEEHRRRWDMSPARQLGEGT